VSDELDFSAPFERLEAGQAFTTEAREVTGVDVFRFAALTGDHHPQHVDRAWAASSPFGEQIAHGMLVLSFAVGLLPLDPARIVALRGIDDAVFKRPVRFGDTIRVDGSIESCEPIGEDTGLVTLSERVEVAA
jgi:3-hydroxybutyryl-CoA dehydratase